MILTNVLEETSLMSQRPQGIILHLAPLISSSSSTGRPPKTAYLGWSGLAAASSLAGIGGQVETIEVDPEVAMGLGWGEGTLVRCDEAFRYLADL